MTDPNLLPLRIAIIGGGPGGLGAAIALSALPNVKLTLYEQAHELREIGAGIRIGYNCWRVLELLGADHDVKGHRKEEVLHRNGLTGDLLLKTSPPSSLPLKYYPHRVRRTCLQSALLKQVPPGIIQLNKRLTALENFPGEEGVRLFFDDGTEDTADLVVGADGIRSVVREYAFPDHRIKFTGTTIWRVLIRRALVAHIPEISTSTSWWHGPAGHAYLSPVDDPSETVPEDEMFEISVRYVVDPESDKERRYSWGIPATKERVEAHFTDYDSRVRETLSKVPEGDWREFAAFAGPRLETLTAWDRLVLIGDASHPLTGAFGSGAAFALEDGWILARAIEHTFYKNVRSFVSYSRGQALHEALSIFDSIRSPYYLGMYQHLDNQKQKMLTVKNVAKSFEDVLQARVTSFGEGSDLSWIYDNDIEDIWQTWLVEKDQLRGKWRDEEGIRTGPSL